MNLADNIDRLILESTKSRDKERTEVFKAIKNEFLIFKTAKDAKPLTEEAEINLLLKMVKQREDSAYQFEQGGRKELAEKERFEISVLKEFLPKEITREDIECKFQELFGDSIEQKQMGVAIKTLKSQLLGADGALIAMVVKEKIQK